MAGVVIGSNAQGVVNDGLVAYLPFINSLNDQSVNRTQPSASSNSYTTDRRGTADSAIALNGMSGFVAYPFAGLPSGPGAKTLAVWAKINAKPVGMDAHIVGFGAGVTGGMFGFFVDPAGSVKFHGYFADLWAADVAAGPSEWMHLAAAYSGTTLTLWVNGQQVNSAAMVLNTGLSGLEVGRWLPNPTVGHFNGSVDQLRIYDRALSDAEVKEIYGFEANAPEPYRAQARAVVVNGFVVGVELIDGGWGYSEAPFIQIVGESGAGATAAATLSGGVVTKVNVVNAGNGYAGAVVSIASPGFDPWLEVRISKVAVTQHVVLGGKYALDSSNDLKAWTQVGATFIATSESIRQEFDVEATGRFYRLRQVP